MGAPPYRQISQIFEFIRDAMIAKRPELTVLLGAHERHTHDNVPRIIFVPSKDSYRDPVKPGTQVLSDPHPLWTVRATFEVDIWGADIDDTEELRRIVIETADECLGRSHQLTSGEWDTAGETAEHGLLYTLLLDVDIPVTIFSSATATATIGSIPLTKVVQTP